jgi:hypothetical protein
VVLNQFNYWILDISILVEVAVMGEEEMKRSPTGGGGF